MTDIVLAIIFSLLAMPFQADADDVLAAVGKKQITVKEFNEKYGEVVAKTMNPPPKDVFLEDLIRYEVGLQEAEKNNMMNDPAVRRKVEEAVYSGLVEKMIGKQVDKIEVNDAEMQSWYKTNPEIKTSHILIQFKPGATEQEKATAKKRAEEIYSTVKKSERPFDELVSLYSDDTISKSNGGDLGWQSRLTLVPNYYQAALRTKKGGITSLIETQYGYHIIKVTDINSYKDANKQQIRVAVFEEKRKKLFDTYFVGLMKKYPIKKNLALLKK